jgi:hypothetical protein
MGNGQSGLVDAKTIVYEHIEVDDARSPVVTGPATQLPLDVLQPLEQRSRWKCRLESHHRVDEIRLRAAS